MAPIYPTYIPRLVNSTAQFSPTGEYTQDLTLVVDAKNQSVGICKEPSGWSLDVQGTIVCSAGIRVGGAVIASLQNTGAHLLGIDTPGMDIQGSLTCSDKVGIGLSYPQEALDVRGNVKCSGNFGCNEAIPAEPVSLGEPATDLASLIVLTNNIREALIACGICR